LETETLTHTVHSRIVRFTVPFSFGFRIRIRVRIGIGVSFRIFIGARGQMAVRHTAQGGRHVAARSA
jgi:hypothetical protein